MTQSILPIIITFIVVMGFFSAFMVKRLQITHTTRPVITSLYFLLASAGVVLAYRVFFMSLIKPVNPLPLAFLLVLIVGSPLVYWYVKKKMHPPSAFIERHASQHFLKLEYRYLIAKSCEILFQQSCITLLVLLLKNAGLSLLTIMVCFAILFGLLHILLIFTSRRIWAIYYTTFSVLSGLVFPPLILSAQSGYIYSFIVHWSFYTLAGVLFWMYHNRELLDSRSSSRYSRHSVSKTALHLF